MTAHEFLNSIKHVPMQMIGDRPVVASKTERGRWLEMGAVIINGKKPKPREEIQFPITELIFFPNGRRKCTMIGD